jgi:diketogulonate reductase-like aldo/keto reductase
MVQTVGYGSMGVHDPKIIELALETGYRVIDSARVYGNEAVCGEGIVNFLKKHPEIKREEIIYTTKINNEAFGYEKATKAIEESLERVKGLGYIDLILVHSPVAPSAARLETYRALQDALEKGICKQIGVSNYGVKVLNELYNWEHFKVKPAYNQIELNPWLQHTDVVEFCQKEGIVVQAYTPFIHNKMDNDPYLQELSKKYKATPSQVLLKWNIQKDIMPLPKSANPERMKLNFDVGFFNLTAKEIEKMGDKNAEIQCWAPDRTRYF